MPPPEGATTPNDSPWSTSADSSPWQAGDSSYVSGSSGRTARSRRWRRASSSAAASRCSAVNGTTSTVGAMGAEDTNSANADLPTRADDHDGTVRDGGQVVHGQLQDRDARSVELLRHRGPNRQDQVSLSEEDGRGGVAAANRLGQDRRRGRRATDSGHHQDPP